MKFVSPEVVKKVGTTAALLLQHINYWLTSQGVEILYRTNQQLVSDLEGMFTESQIQYAKTKLKKLGLISLSFPKSYDRTTHYSITEAGVKLLTSAQKLVSKVVGGEVINGEVISGKTKEQNDSTKETEPDNKPNDKPKKWVDWSKVGRKSNNKINSTVNSSPSTLANTKAMQESFNEGFTNENATKIPEHLLGKLKGMLKRNVQTNSPETNSPVTNSPVTTVLHDENDLVSKRDAIVEVSNFNDSGIGGMNVSDDGYNANSDDSAWCDGGVLDARLDNHNHHHNDYSNNYTDEDFIADQHYDLTDDIPPVLFNTGIQSCVDNNIAHKQGNTKVTLSSLMNDSFNRIPNVDIFEERRIMKEQFREDY